MHRKTQWKQTSEGRGSSTPLDGMRNSEESSSTESRVGPGSSLLAGFPACPLVLPLQHSNEVLTDLKARSQYQGRKQNVLPPLQLQSSAFGIWPCGSPHHSSHFSLRVSGLLLLLTWTTRRQGRGPWHLVGWTVRTRSEGQAAPFTGCGAGLGWQDHGPEAQDLDSDTGVVIFLLCNPPDLRLFYM